jgi:hypothetical protein
MAEELRSEEIVELCPNYFGLDGCYRDGCRQVELARQDSSINVSPRNCIFSPLYNPINTLEVTL